MRKKGWLLTGVALVVGMMLWGCGQTSREILSSTTLVVSPDAALLKIGNTQQFKVNGLTTSSIVTQEATWAVFGGIGTIDATGLFTATAEGAGSIEARIGSIVGKANVTVSAEKYEGLIVLPASSTLTVGQTQAFKVNGLKVKSATVSASVSWEVVGGIGTIDANGVFTATREGIGTIEALADSLIGRANVTVSGPVGQTITGKLVNIYSGNKNISSGFVTAGGVSGQCQSDGSFTLKGVPSDAELISAAVPNFVTTSVPISVSNIPCGFPAQNNYYFPSYEYTDIKGRLVDGGGNPISSNDNYSLTIAIANCTTSSLMDNNGNFSAQIGIPKGKYSETGYILFVDNTTQTGLVKEITIVKGVTLEVGDITVSEPLATISGQVITSAGLPIAWSYISCGLIDSAGNKIQFNILSPNNSPNNNGYSVQVPPTPSGLKYYLSYWSFDDDRRSAITINIKDISVVAGGTLNQDLLFPQSFTATFPADGQLGVSTHPKFEWSSAGDGYAYMVAVGNGNGVTRWLGLTNETSIEYPVFPVGSGGETSNLQAGQSYYCSITAFKGLDINNITNVNDFINSSTIISVPAISFGVAGASATSAKSVKSMSVGGKAVFEKNVMGLLGIRAPKK